MGKSKRSKAPVRGRSRSRVKNGRKKYQHVTISQVDAKMVEMWRELWHRKRPCQVFEEMVVARAALEELNDAADAKLANPGD